MSDLKLSSMDFDSMDFKDLRNAVKACYKENIMLRDEIAIMKRKYEDIIYNLDDENFSSRFVKEKNNMRTSIEQTEEAITLQAERIDENNKQFMTKLTQTAETIRLQAETYATNAAETAKASAIEISSENIRMVSSATITAHFEADSPPSESDEDIDAKKQMLWKCTSSNGSYTADNYYYWDGTAWEAYPEGGIKSLFVQAPSGFELTGNVFINGSLITDGSISATKINTDELRVSKIYDKESDNAFAAISSRYGDFGVYYDPNNLSLVTPVAPANENICLWGVEHSDGAGKAVNFYSYGNNFLGYNAEKGKTFPKGEWDFSSCTSTAFPDTVVAVFG